MVYIINQIKISRHHYSRGGLWAHILRRVVHLASILILWLYYQYGSKLAHWIGISLPQLVWSCLGIILILEALRLYRGWTVFGQRHYEQKRLSAFAWGVIGMTLVIIFAPGKQFAIPIICAYAIGDPLLGELRRAKFPGVAVALIGIIVICGIWWLAHIYLGTPLWLVFLMGPLTVAAEWPCFSWVDDNALMQIVPLLAIIILQ